MKRWRPILIGFVLLQILQPAWAQPVDSGSRDDPSADTTQANFIFRQQTDWVEEGQGQASFEKIRQAQNIYRENGLWEKYVECLLLSARLGEKTSYELKNDYADQAISAIGQYLPDASLLRARAFYQKAEALIGLDMPDSSFFYFRQIVPVFKEHEQWKDLTYCELLMAVNYVNAGIYDSCEIHLEAGLDIIRQHRLEDDLKTDFLNIKSILCYIRGDYNQAIRLINQAIDIKWHRPHKNSDDTLFVLGYYTNLGAFYNIKGDFKRAEDCFLKIIGISAEMGEDIIVSDPETYNNLGKLLIRQERYREAIAYFNKNLSYHQRQILSDPANRVDSYNELSNCFLKLEILDSVKYYAERTLAEPGFNNHYLAFFRLGQYHLAKGHNEEAIRFFEKSKRHYSEERDRTADPNFFIKFHFFVGEAYAAGKNYSTALKYYQQALALNSTEVADTLDPRAQPQLEGVSDPFYFLETLQAKAEVLAAMGGEGRHLETAYETYNLATQWIDTMRINYAEEGDRLFWGKKFKKIYGEAAETGRRLFTVNHQPQYLEETFVLVEKSKSLLLLEALKASEGVALAGLPDSLVKKEKDLGIDVVFFEKSLRKAREANDSAQVEFNQSQLANTRLELARLKEYQERNYPAYYSLKYGGQNLRIADLQSFLPNNQTAFLEYFLDDQAAFVLVVTTAQASLVPLGNKAAVGLAARQFLQELTNPEPFRQNAKVAFSTYNRAAFSLYEVAVAPALETLTRDVDQLIIVPDGILHSVPFEALTTELAPQPSIDFATMPYLISRFQVHYGYSARLLLNNRESQRQLPPNTRCYAVAPPYQGVEKNLQKGDLNQLESKTAQLEGTALEIKAIADWFPGEFDFGSTATEATFKRKASQFGLLHLAMHGQADFENVNFAHLTFTDLLPDTTDDNLLHHYEIANLALNAQLVVLSACETGLGKYEEGEGVFSLARSFMYAGVPSVVMSLWKVSDQSTSLLMPRFYKNLSGGMPKKSALHQAKMAFLQEEDLALRHPYFWSGFVLLGDAEPIKGQRNYIWWVMAGVFFIGMMVWGARRWGFGPFRKEAV